MSLDISAIPLGIATWLFDKGTFIVFSVAAVPCITFWDLRFSRRRIWCGDTALYLSRRSSSSTVWTFIYKLVESFPRWSAVSVLLFLLLCRKQTFFREFCFTILSAFFLPRFKATELFWWFLLNWHLFRFWMLFSLALSALPPSCSSNVLLLVKHLSVSYNQAKAVPVL